MILRQVEAPASHLIDAVMVVYGFRTLFYKVIGDVWVHEVPTLFSCIKSCQDRSVTKIFGGGWLLARI